MIRRKKKEVERGDVVRLKSGGRKMTVSYIRDDGLAKCYYDDPIRGITSEYFDKIILKVIE